MAACKEGVNLTMDWSDKPLIIETDSLQAVPFLQEDALNRSPVATLV